MGRPVSQPRRPRPMLYLPPGSSLHNETPKFACHLCEEREPGAGLFYTHAAYVSHFDNNRCADLEAKVRAKSFTLRAPGLFDPWYEGSDVEWGRFIDRMWRERPEQWRRWMKTSDGKR